MENAIISEMATLLQKSGVGNIIPDGFAGDRSRLLETTLINLKTLNARYEKADALSQIRWLMDAYNIQIDEVIERIRP